MLKVRCYQCGERLTVKDDVPSSDPEDPRYWDPDWVLDLHIKRNCSNPRSDGRKNERIR